MTDLFPINPTAIAERMIAAGALNDIAGPGSSLFAGMQSRMAIRDTHARLVAAGEKLGRLYTMPRALTEAEHDQAGALESEVHDLQRDLRAMVQRQCGVSFDELAKVL